MDILSSWMDEIKLLQLEMWTAIEKNEFQDLCFLLDHRYKLFHSIPDLELNDCDKEKILIFYNYILELDVTITIVLEKLHQDIGKQLLNVKKSRKALNKYKFD